MGLSIAMPIPLVQTRIVMYLERIQDIRLILGRQSPSETRAFFLFVWAFTSRVGTSKAAARSKPVIVPMRLQPLFQNFIQ